MSQKQYEATMVAIGDVIPVGSTTEEAEQAVVAFGKLLVAAISR